MFLTLSASVFFVGSAQTQTTGQPDPCQLKTRVVGDQTYCDRYWECVNGQAQLFDCPNGLVFIGRNRGIAEGCDYPWRGNYCLNKQTASKFTNYSFIVRNLQKIQHED